MRKFAVIAVTLLVIAACVDKNPSWMISWDNPSYPQGERDHPQSQSDTTERADTTDGPGDEVKLAVPFSEDFDEVSPEGFVFSLHDSREDFRYFSAFPSFSETGTDILLLRLDPKDAAGVANGPRLTLDSLSFYGSYSIRVRIPDLSRIKKKTDAVFEFGVEGKDNNDAVSSVSIGWSLSEPSRLSLIAIAGTAETPVNTEFSINVAEVLSRDFSAASSFYTYGFDWKEDSVEWWIINPSTKAKKVLAKTDALPSVPKVPATLSIGARHISAAPKYPFEIEIDSISYTEL